MIVGFFFARAATAKSPAKDTSGALRFKGTKRVTN